MHKFDYRQVKEGDGFPSAERCLLSVIKILEVGDVDREKRKAAFEIVEKFEECVRDAEADGWSCGEW